MDLGAPNASPDEVENSEERGEDGRARDEHCEDSVQVAGLVRWDRSWDRVRFLDRFGSTGIYHAIAGSQKGGWDADGKPKSEGHQRCANVDLFLSLLNVFQQVNEENEHYAH